MGRQLAAKREQLKELQRAGRRPSVKSVKEKDVIAALTHLRVLLQGDVGVAAQVLEALVGDVILEARQIEGQAKPQMVARFTSTPCRLWPHASAEGRRIATSHPPQSGARSTQARPTSRPPRAGPPRPLFHSRTTAGRPQEGCANPSPGVDSVRRTCYFFLHVRSSEVARLARRENPRRPPASGPGMRRGAVGFSRPRKPKGH